MVAAHEEFVKYCCFINLVAETVQFEPKLIRQLHVCLFNNFLVDCLQARLLAQDLEVKRTAF